METDSTISTVSYASWPSVRSVPSTLRTSYDDAPVRIAVIGGGLALGQLLYGAPNVEITVYERSVDSIDRLCGYRVMLSGPVLLQLRATLPEEVWHRVETSIGIQPDGGQELAFLKRYFRITAKQ